MSWLVTGGAGYIGSHVVQAFLDAGITPVVIDDLSSGHADFVPKGVVFVQGTILDTDLVTRTLTENACEGVVHLAGFKYAGVSVSRPLHTYDQNVTGTVSLLRAMQSVGVHNYVFSSSASVYGTPDVDQVTEQTPTAPESPYGQTKLIGEWLAGDIAKVDPQWRYTNLRYFNVVGSGSDALYDTSPHNLFPIVFDALLAGRTPKIFGDDYPTPDGTCVRDYVHVADLAISHVAAAKAMAAGTGLQVAYNLGSGDGSSVAEIMSAIARVTGVDFTPEIAARRPGDPARIVANGDAAARDIDWKMRYTLDEMVSSAWSARQAHQS
ncbi:UDP-glucose 4-epimerase GalE [Brooklawnia propionicigenes]|jgi:UDP-glucose 4-epimerase|uniref:UDP-glucose 4-epimerase n=1 Tax=Brooklawnia propionicigenes TaxID=3041175 RepID=A0AAN0K6X2_9ACTN|nr:UDP-glucose 4-epimerase GalE [Brooklawnia sp. SH051]MEA5121310.1 UDP-glucose 4-epimerase GalE [Propionibacterium sp.]BEH02350.1 UDP-glucose 4-epimerase GalE [Brooklawnia sp. SH051]